MADHDRMTEAKAAADRKEWSRAADLLNGDDSTEVRRTRAFYLSRAERYDEAIAQLEILREREPRSARIPYMIGFQYSQREEWSDAIEWYRRALELAPD